MAVLLALGAQVQRLAPEKGTMRALEALSRLDREGAVAGGNSAASGRSGALSLDGRRRVHLMIAGDGPSKVHLEAYAAKNRLPVTFLGNVPNGQLPQYYRAADVFVTCSTSETYGERAEWKQAWPDRHSLCSDQLFARATAELYPLCLAGLTVLESLACCTPVVLPHCGTHHRDQI